MSGSLNELREAAEKIPSLVVRPLRGVGVKAGPLRKQKKIEKRMTTKLEGEGGLVI